MDNIKDLALLRLNEYRTFVSTSNTIAGEKLGRVQDLLNLLPDDERHAFGRENGVSFGDSREEVASGIPALEQNES